MSFSNTKKNLIFREQLSICMTKTKTGGSPPLKFGIIDLLDLVPAWIPRCYHLVGMTLIVVLLSFSSQQSCSSNLPGGKNVIAYRRKRYIRPPHHNAII